MTTDLNTTAAEIEETAETYTDVQRTAARLEMITLGHTTTVWGIAVTRWDADRFEIGTLRHSGAVLRTLAECAAELTERWHADSAQIAWNDIRWGGPATLSRTNLAERIQALAAAQGVQIKMVPDYDDTYTFYSLAVQPRSAEAHQELMDAIHEAAGL